MLMVMFFTEAKLRQHLTDLDLILNLKHLMV